MYIVIEIINGLIKVEKKIPQSESEMARWEVGGKRNHGPQRLLGTARNTMRPPETIFPPEKKQKSFVFTPNVEAGDPIFSFLLSVSSVQHGLFNSYQAYM
jgi:hypothetical protein